MTDVTSLLCQISELFIRVVQQVLEKVSKQQLSNDLFPSMTNELQLLVTEQLPLVN